MLCKRLAVDSAACFTGCVRLEHGFKAKETHGTDGDDVPTWNPIGLLLIKYLYHEFPLGLITERNVATQRHGLVLKIETLGTECTMGNCDDDASPCGILSLRDN